MQLFFHMFQSHYEIRIARVERAYGKAESP